jgi:hypothetical protein
LKFFRCATSRFGIVSTRALWWCEGLFALTQGLHILHRRGEIIVAAVRRHAAISLVVVRIALHVSLPDSPSALP